MVAGSTSTTWSGLHSPLSTLHSPLSNLHSALHSTVRAPRCEAKFLFCSVVEVRKSSRLLRLVVVGTGSNFVRCLVVCLSAGFSFISFGNRIIWWHFDRSQVAGLNSTLRQESACLSAARRVLQSYTRPSLPLARCGGRFLWAENFQKSSKCPVLASFIITYQFNII